MPVGDRYTTLREIGRGGAGVVIAVQDRVVGRSVALKRR
jgi:serine/threonine protein kinase